MDYKKNKRRQQIENLYNPLILDKENKPTTGDHNPICTHQKCKKIIERLPIQCLDQLNFSVLISVSITAHRCNESYPNQKCFILCSNFE